MREDLEVTGPIVLTLFASSSAPDTDFAATLVDVHPDGKAIILCEGLLRARFRDSIEHPSLIEPGQYHCVLHFGASCMTFTATTGVDTTERAFIQLIFRRK